MSKGVSELAKWFVLLMSFLFLSSIVLALNVDEELKKAEDALNRGEVSTSILILNKAAYRLESAGDSQKAIDLYLKSLTLTEQNNNSRAVISICYKLAAMYSGLNQSENALKYLQKGIDENIKIGDSQGIAEGYYNLGIACQNFGMHRMAVDNLVQARDKFKELHNLILLRKTYMALYSSYEALGDNTEASQCYTLYSAIDKKIKKDEFTKIKTGAEEQVKNAISSKQKAEAKLSKTSRILEQTVDTLNKTKKITVEQQLAIELKETKIRETEVMLNLEQMRRSRYAIAFAASVLVLVLIVIFILRLRKAHKLISQQKKQVELQNANIKSSLDYAKMIQDILLPDRQSLLEKADVMILYKPKDIVSGDFYWHGQIICEMNQRCVDYIAVADCTGHGVPGALMSMVGHRLLNEIVNEKKITEVDDILEELDRGVVRTLKQDTTSNRDGMEIALCKFMKVRNGEYTLDFAGAKRPLFIIRNHMSEIETVKPSRRAIGGRRAKGVAKSFEKHNISLQAGDTLYMMSDGFVDQQNNQRLKYGSVALKQKLLSIVELPLDMQEREMEIELENHMQGEEQRDDISFMAIRIK